MASPMTAEQLRKEIVEVAQYARTRDLANDDGKKPDARSALVQIANTLDQLAARLSGMAAVPQWQPIETAPLRTRVIVGYRNELGLWRTAVATYFTEDDVNDWENEDCSPGWYERSYAHEERHEYVYALEFAPLYWQSLPASPDTPHV